MKKYKLKKWYPSLHEQVKEGDIAKLEKSKCGDKYAIKLDPPKCVQWLDKEEVENNPEFWEEVEKKNYEVLKVQTTSKHPRHFSGTVNSHIFDFNEGHIKGLFNSHPDWWKIYSVRRKSDGEVFTIGDNVRYNYEDRINRFTIDGFRSSKGGKDIKAYQGKSFNKCDNYCELSSSFFTHSSPLFTTEDGVDIHQGDKFWMVTRNWTIKSSHGGNSLLKATWRAKLSEKEKAEEYVKEHKPRYSKADVKEAYQSLYEVCKFGDPFGHTNFRTLINQLENE